MAIQLAAGFDGWTDDWLHRQFAVEDVTYTGVTYPKIAVGDGRDGGDCLLFAGSANATINIPETDTVTVGMAIHLDVLPLGTQTLFIIRQGALSNLTMQLTGTGGLLLTRGTTFQWAPSATITVGAGVWHYIECQCYAAQAEVPGRIVVRHNNNVVLDVTGDTLAYSSPLFQTGVTLGQGNYSTAQVYMDDVYILDGDTGGAVNFLGDTKIVRMPLVSNGSQNDLTHIDNGTGNTRIETLEDESPDTYLQGVSGTELFVVGSLGYTPVHVHAIIAETQVYKTDAGDKSIRAKVKHGASYGNSDSLGVPSTIGVVQRVMETNPVTGLAWDPSDLPEEIGFEVV